MLIMLIAKYANMCFWSVVYTPLAFRQSLPSCIFPQDWYDIDRSIHLFNRWFNQGMYTSANNLFGELFSEMSLFP